MRDFEKCSDKHGRKVVYLFAPLFLSDLWMCFLHWLYSTSMVDSYFVSCGQLVLIIVQFLLVPLMAVVLFKDVWRQAFTQFFSDIRRRSFNSLFYTLFIGFIAIVVIVWGIGPILFGMLKRTSVNQQAVESFVRSDALGILQFIEIVILGPFVEETEFRCGLFRLVRGKNVVAAHVISGLLFGFAHVMLPVIYGVYEELWFLIDYAFCGFVFSMIYEKTKCLVYPLLFHAAINFISFVGMLYS